MFSAPFLGRDYFILNILRHKGSIIFPKFSCVFTRASVLIYMRLRICKPVHALKKRAKVLLFSDMTKYFCKKNQKKCILQALLGILGIIYVEIHLP